MPACQQYCTATITRWVLWAVALVLEVSVGWAQSIAPEALFAGDELLEVKLLTDFKQLRRNKKQPTWQPATIWLQQPQQPFITGQIRIKLRGNIRKEICDIPTLHLNFRNNTSPRLYDLETVKWVGSCRGGRADEELLVREYLVYKMYNQLTPLSFRVRMMRVTYVDSRDTTKKDTQLAFLIERTEEMGRRNGMKEKKSGVYRVEATHRMNCTLVNVFQYMIGNTDFSISARHNVKLMVPRADTSQPPYVVPYDFDYAGIVNAHYAVPNEQFNLPSVRVRLYRGFSRTESEVDSILHLFIENKANIEAVIEKCNWLGNKAKSDMLAYIETFYNLAQNSQSARRVFISGARKD